MWMTYGSYVNVHKPVLGSAIAIAALDTCYSLLAGFGVFSIVGFLRSINYPLSSQKGIELAFSVIPSALSMTSENPRFWCCFLYLSWFMLAMDTQMAWVETVVTSICDVHIFAKLKRRYVVAFICIISAGLSSMYTSNSGLVHRNTAASDRVQGYFVFGAAFFACTGATWWYKFTYTSRRYSRRATVALVVCYWVPLIGSAFIHWVNSDWLIHAFVIFTGWMIIVIIALKFVIRHCSKI